MKRWWSTPSRRHTVKTKIVWPKAMQLVEFFLKKLSRSRPLFLYFHLFRYSFFNTNGSKKCLWLDSKRGSLVVGSNCSINYATTTDQSRLKSIYAISLLLPCLIHHWVNGSGKESLTYYYVVGTTLPKRLNLFQCGIKILFFFKLGNWTVANLINNLCS